MEYQKDKIKIYNCDFREIAKNIKNNSIDLILTDPPYLTNFKCVGHKDKLSGKYIKAKHNYNDSYKSTKGRDTIKDFFNEAYRVLKNDGLLLFFMNEKRLLYFMNCATDFNFWQTYFITWKKNTIKPNQYHTDPHKRCEYILGYRKDRLNKIKYNPNLDLYDCIEFDNIVGATKNHPNEKPQKILMYFLKLFNYQNKKDFNIFDPFMGGGSLAKACQDFNTYIFDNINYIGTELDQHYFENAKELIALNNRIYEFALQKKDKNEKTLLNLMEAQNEN